jgi:hypothetical protein
MDLKFNTLSTFEARKLAMHSRHRRELQLLELDETLSLPTSVKRSRRLESGALPRMPDILLLRICRMLAPAEYSSKGRTPPCEEERQDSATDLLNLEIVCHDMTECLRRSSHLALYPHIPATIPATLFQSWRLSVENTDCDNWSAMDAREQFFYYRALREISNNQCATSSCFSQLGAGEKQQWLNKLAEHRQNVLPSEMLQQAAHPPALIVPERSVDIMMAVVEPVIVILLQSALNVACKKSDRPVIVDCKSLLCAHTILWAHRNSGRGGETIEKYTLSTVTQMVFEENSLMIELPFDLSLSIRELGYRAGIPRLSPGALTKVLGLLHFSLREILEHAYILATYANQPLGEYDDEKADDKKADDECGDNDETAFSYPTSACYRDDSTGQDTVILGTSVVIKACQAAGYKMYDMGWENDRAQEKEEADAQKKEEADARKLRKENAKLKEMVKEMQQKLTSINDLLAKETGASTRASTRASASTSTIALHGASSVSSGEQEPSSDDECSGDERNDKLEEGELAWLQATASGLANQPIHPQ